jgi:hypothetical protein
LRELEEAIAAVFKAKGLQSIGERDFVMFVSMDRRWLTPAEGQRLLEAGLAAKLLERDGSKVKPTFDVSKTEIPSGFVPDKRALAQSEPEATFPVLVRAICTATKLGKREVVALVNKKQEEAGVEIEVAAMLVAAEKGLDVSGYSQRVKMEILERYSQG